MKPTAALLTYAALPDATQAHAAGDTNTPFRMHLARNANLSYETWRALLEDDLTEDDAAWLAISGRTGDHLAEYHAAEQRLMPSGLAVERWGMCPAAEAKFLKAGLSEQAAEYLLGRSDVSDALRRHAASRATAATKLRWGAVEGDDLFTSPLLLPFFEGINDGLVVAFAHRQRARYRSYVATISDVTAAVRAELDVTYMDPALIDAVIDAFISDEECPEFGQSLFQDTVDHPAVTAAQLDRVRAFSLSEVTGDSRIRDRDQAASAIAYRDEAGSIGIHAPIDDVASSDDIGDLLRWVTRPDLGQTFTEQIVAAWVIVALSTNPHLGPEHAALFAHGARAAVRRVDPVSAAQIRAAADRLGVVVSEKTSELWAPYDKSFGRQFLARFGSQLIAIKEGPVVAPGDLSMSKLSTGAKRDVIVAYLHDAFGDDAASWNLLLGLADTFSGTVSEAVDHIHRLVAVHA